MADRPRIVHRLTVPWRQDLPPVLGASIAARLSILALLIAAGRALPPADFHVVALSIATASAAQLLLEPSSLCNYVVARSRPPEVDEDAFVSARRLALCGAFVTFALPGAIAYAAASGSGLPIGLAIGAASAGENLGRFSRVVWQVRSRFGMFAAVDAVAACLRSAVACATFFSGDTRVLVVTSSLTFLAGPFWLVLASRQLRAEGHTTLLGSVGAVAPFAGMTFFSALYSQGPVLMVGVLGSLRAAAMLSIATRLVQPLELVPVALASTYLPRLRGARGGPLIAIFRRQLAIAAIAGLAAALGALLVAPGALLAMHVEIGQAWPLVVILALALPFKFANYQYAAFAVAQDLVRQRLRIVVFAGFASLAASFALAPHNVELVAATSLGVEAFLFAAMRSLVSARAGVARAYR